MPISSLQHRNYIGAYQAKSGADPMDRGSQTQPSPCESPTTPPDAPTLNEDLSKEVRTLNRHHDASSTALIQSHASRTAFLMRMLTLLGHVGTADSSILTQSSPSTSARLAAASPASPPAFAPASSTASLPAPASLPLPNLAATTTTPNVPTGRPPLAGRMRRHVPLENRATTTTASPQRDDVKIERIDFSCIDNRSNLSFADMLRQAGRTFRNPIGELAQEFQVVRYVKMHGRCPTEAENRRLASITTVLDHTLTILSGILPGGQPALITQTVGGPLFEMMADSIDGKETNLNNLQDATEGFLALAQTIKTYSPKDAQGQPLVDQLIVPKDMSFKGNKLSVALNGEVLPLTYKDNRLFVDRSGTLQEVSYSWKTREWFKVEHGRRNSALSPDGVTRATLIPAGEHNGRMTYRQIDLETGQPFGETYVISRKGKMIPYHVVESEVERYKQEPSTTRISACGVGARVRRAPCTVSDTPNSLGLYEQQGFSGKLYRVETRPPIDIIRTDGFGSSHEFIALNRMVENRDLLIVAESMQGILRYIKKYQGENYYIYEIAPRGIRGVSLRDNILNHPDGARTFLGADPAVGTNVDWGYLTNGAVFLDEAHVYAEDVTTDKIKFLGRSHDPDFKKQLDELELGVWADYL